MVVANVSYADSIYRWKDGNGGVHYTDYLPKKTNFSHLTALSYRNSYLYKDPSAKTNSTSSSIELKTKRVKHKLAKYARGKNKQFDCIC